MTLIIKTSGFDDYLDLAGGAYLKVLIMGPPSVGKTRSASFYPKPIFADCEKGRMSIADRGVPYAEIRSIADMDALLERLRIECLKAPENRSYRTLVIDTLDSWQRIIIAERLRTERREALSGWADWGFLDAKMTQFVEKLLNLPMNIVVNVHTKDQADKSSADDDDSFMVKKPKLKGDIREQIAAEFDLVGHMESHYEAVDGERTLKREIRWWPEPKYPDLKDRSGRLPRFTEIDFTPEDYGRIFGAILGKHVDDLPETKVVEELAVEGGVAPTDAEGGPMPPSKLQNKPAARGTAKKAAAAAAPKRAEPKVEVEKVSDPPTTKAEPVLAEQSKQPEQPEDAPSTDVDELSEDRRRIAEQAVEVVAERLGGEVVSDEPTEAPKPARRAEKGPVCGEQPTSLAGRYPPVPGCGKSLADESRDLVNIAILKTKTMLCKSCYDAWKNAN